VTEGKAKILFPTSTNEVFYNPIQQFNRDLSIACIQEFTKLYKEDVQAGKLKRAAPEEVPITVLEALSATGLRAVRYFHEIPGLTYVVANDLSQDAVKNIERNVLSNGLRVDQVVPNHGDAWYTHAPELPALFYLFFGFMENNTSNVMHAHKLAPSSANPADNARFTVVDLDPYGTAAPFLDSAVQSVDEGGLMCVTCTDMAVLSGRHSDPCFAKYGSVPLTMPSCHENVIFLWFLKMKTCIHQKWYQALRILLASITQHAARHKRVIVPLLSLSIDFYVRVFVRVYTSAHETKRIGTYVFFFFVPQRALVSSHAHHRMCRKLSQLYRCNGCKTFHLQPLMHESTGADGRQTRRSPSTGPIVPQLCPFCKCTYSIGGPLWSDPIHDPAFVSNLLARINAAPQGTFATKQRMQAMVTLASEELANSPLYYTIPDLCHTVRATAPPLVTFLYFTTASVIKVTPLLLFCTARPSSTPATRSRNRTPTRMPSRPTALQVGALFRDLH